jgi:hypothetical protein
LDSIGIFCGSGAIDAELQALASRILMATRGQSDGSERAKMNREMRRV